MLKSRHPQKYIPYFPNQNYNTEMEFGAHPPNIRVTLTPEYLPRDSNKSLRLFQISKKKVSEFASEVVQYHTLQTLIIAL